MGRGIKYILQWKYVVSEFQFYFLAEARTSVTCLSSPAVCDHPESCRYWLCGRSLWKGASQSSAVKHLGRRKRGSVLL